MSKCAEESIFCICFREVENLSASEKKLFKKAYIFVFSTFASWIDSTKAMVLITPDAEETREKKKSRFINVLVRMPLR